MTDSQLFFLEEQKRLWGKAGGLSLSAATNATRPALLFLTHHLAFLVTLGCWILFLPF